MNESTNVRPTPSHAPACTNCACICFAVFSSLPHPGSPWKPGFHLASWSRTLVPRVSGVPGATLPLPQTETDSTYKVWCLPDGKLPGESGRELHTWTSQMSPIMPLMTGWLLIHDLSAGHHSGQSHAFYGPGSWGCPLGCHPGGDGVGTEAHTQAWILQQCHLPGGKQMTITNSCSDTTTSAPKIAGD